MPLDPARRFPLMCLTMDGISISHSLQAARLCAAGARWIQLRMKDVEKTAWTAEARAVADICRHHGAVFIVNDSVDVAMECEADGVHLGGLDEEWTVARHRLGPGFIIGGTVNNLAQAKDAVASAALDYVGVGPLHFTSTKRNLAPVLGIGGVHMLIKELGDLPAWVIGGVEPSDLPHIRSAGGSGVAVSSSLYRDGKVEDNFRGFLDTWNRGSAALHPLSHS